jgi:hypothetical protein
VVKPGWTMRVGRQGKNIEAESTVALLLHVNQVFSKILGWIVAHPVTQLPPPMGWALPARPRPPARQMGAFAKHRLIPKDDEVGPYVAIFVLTAQHDSPTAWFAIFPQNQHAPV